MPYNCPDQVIEYEKSEKLLESLGPFLKKYAEKYDLKLRKGDRGWSERFLANYEMREQACKYREEHFKETRKKIFRHVQIFPTGEGKKLKIWPAAFNDRYENKSQVWQSTKSVRKWQSELIEVDGGNKRKFKKALKKACKLTLSWKLEDLVDA